MRCFCRIDRALSSSLFMVPLSLFLLVPIFLQSGCGHDESPAEQVRAFVRAGEEAIEQRDPGAVRDLIAADYQDDQGRSRRDLVALTARYIFMNKSIYLLTRIDDLIFPEEDLARLTILVAMTGRNVSDLDSLLNMQADLYRFEVEVARRDGEWQLTRASWRPARSEDFF